MRPFFSRRNAALSSLFALLMLSGCGGGGHPGSSATPASIAAKAFKNANVEGTFDTPDKAHTRANVPTTVTVQFADDNSSGTGVASFVTGEDYGGDTFQSYSAEIANLALDPQKVPDGTLGSTGNGTVAFDLYDFTVNKYFTGTKAAPVKFVGTYTVDSSGHVSLKGTLSGKDPSGNATAVAVAFAYQTGTGNIDLSGTYSGSLTYPTYLVGIPVFSFDHAPFTKPSGDGLHLNVSIPIHSTGTPLTPDPIDTTLTFKGAYTRSSISGTAIAPVDLDFDLPIIGQLSVHKGEAFQIYLKSTDNGQTLKGVCAINLVGFRLAYPFTATKDPAGGGGTTSALAKGFYNGTITPGGGAATNLYLDVRNATSTAGSNGAAAVGGTVVTGGQVSTVTSSNGLVTTKIVGITGARDTITLVGKVQSGTYFGDYTATTDAGGAETGSFSVDFVNNNGPLSLAGNYTGVLDSNSPSGQHSDVSLTVAQSGDVLTLSTTSTLDGLPLAGIKAVLAYDNIVSETTVAVSGGNVKLSLYGNRRADGGIDLNYTLYGPTGTVSDSGVLQVSKS